MNTGDYRADDEKIFYLLNRMSEFSNNKIEEKDISDLIIKIDKNSIMVSDERFTLTRIVVDIDGLITPDLKGILDGYQIYSIINKEGNIVSITEEGKEYIKERTKKLYGTDFQKVTDSIMNMHYACKNVKRR